MLCKYLRVKADHAKEFDFDINALCGDLRQEQERSGKPTVRLPPKKVERKSEAA